MKSQQAVPYPDFAGWVNAARLSGGKAAASMSWAELQAVAQRKYTKRTSYICLPLETFQTMES
jgi:hypothetical protein